MRRPRWGVVLTVVVALGLAGTGAAIALRAGDGSAPTSGDRATPAPSTPPAPRPDTSSHAPPSPTRSARPRPTTEPPSATATSCPVITEDVPLRVVSLNIHFGIGPQGFDLQRLASAIRRWDADVVLLQEVDRFRRRSRYLDVPARLQRLTGMHAAFGANVRRGGSQYGVATLSRHPVVQVTNTLLPNRPGLEQRGLLRTDIRVAGTVVSVFNTHLQNGVPSMRTEQLSVIRSLVLATPHAAVLGGDLNSGPRSRQMQFARSFLRDVWPGVGIGRGDTAPARHPRYRIDYILVTDPLEAIAARRLPELLSDHLAVLADLVLPVGTEVCVPLIEGPLGGTGPGGADAGTGH